MPNDTTPDPDVDADWTDFWEPLMTTDGVPDMAKIKEELYVWHVCIREVGKAYCELTGDMVSKPTTRAEYVVDMNREMWESDFAERLKEAREMWEQKPMADTPNNPLTPDDLARLRHLSRNTTIPPNHSVYPMSPRWGLDSDVNRSRLYEIAAFLPRLLDMAQNARTGPADGPDGSEHSPAPRNATGTPQDAKTSTSVFCPTPEDNDHA